MSQEFQKIGSSSMNWWKRGDLKDYLPSNEGTGIGMTFIGSNCWRLERRGRITRCRCRLLHFFFSFFSPFFHLKTMEECSRGHNFCSSWLVVAC